MTLCGYYDGLMASTDPLDRAQRRVAVPPSESAVDALLRDQPRMLNLAQVGEVLSTSTPTIRRLVEAGSLPAVRLSRQWRVARDDLREYLLTPSGLEDDTESPDAD